MKKNIIIATVLASLFNLGLQAQDAGDTGALAAYKDRYVQPTSAVSTQPAVTQAPPSTTGTRQVVTQASPSTTAAQPATVTQTPASTTQAKPVAKSGRFFGFF